MPVDEKRLEESTDEIEKRVEENRRRASTRIEPKTIALFGIAMVGILWMTYTDRIDIRWGVGLIAIASYLFYYMSQQTKGMEELDEQILKNLTYRKLRWKQAHTEEIARGKIVMGLAGKTELRGGIPWIRSMHFRLLKQNGIEEDWVAYADPFTANLRAAEKKTEGYHGDEKMRVEWIKSPDVDAEGRYYKAVGKKKKVS